MGFYIPKLFKRWGSVGPFIDTVANPTLNLISLCENKIKKLQSQHDLELCCKLLVNKCSADNIPNFNYQAHIRGRGLSRVGNIFVWSEVWKKNYYWSNKQKTVRLNLKTECCPKTFQGVHLLHFLLLAIFINFSCSYIIVMRSKKTRNCRLYIYSDVTC